MSLCLTLQLASTAPLTAELGEKRSPWVGERQGSVPASAYALGNEY
jgi:hypothetical protein